MSSENATATALMSEFLPHTLGAITLVSSIGAREPCLPFTDVLDTHGHQNVGRNTKYGGEAKYLLRQHKQETEFLIKYNN